MADSVVGGILTGCAVWDIRKRSLPAWLLIGACLCAAGYRMFVERSDLYSLLGGMGMGILFLGISKATKESFGYGDSMGILALGIYLGFWDLAEVLCYAFFLLAVGAVIVLTIRKMSRKATLAFYPFLACGYAVWIWLEHAA